MFNLPKSCASNLNVPNIYIILILSILSSQIFGQVKRDSLTTKNNNLNFIITIPEGNSIYFNSNKLKQGFAGFMLFTTGLKYYYSDNNGLLLNTGFVMDFVIPFPAPYDCEGCESMTSIFTSINNETDIFNSKINIGYGLSYTLYNHNKEKLEFDGVDSVYNACITRRNGIGLNLSAYYNIYKSLRLGFNYVPSIYEFRERKFRYYHTLFFDIRFDINIR